MLGGIKGWEIVIIVLAILLIFGPKNLPKLGSAIGKTMSNLRSGMNAGKKKDGEGEEPEAETASDDNVAEAQPAVIEGEVDPVEAADDSEAVEAVGAVEEVAEEAPEIVVEEEPEDLAEEAADKTADAVADEVAEAPKKVRRVVKKKVAVEKPAETE